ncbi:MAG: FGGY family carbohydrate kinase, partial [Emcibacteraceae bacterium]|nr:FGGY family carbohydrate kinase [Emcibacteraceae bacterium]
MNQDQSTVIGIDIGTQSIKVVIYHPGRKEVLASASQPFELTSKEDGSMEQQASWWVGGLHKCLDSISPEIKKTVVAIGVSGQQHGFVPIDKEGNVLAPVKLWCDTSTTLECEEIMDMVGGEEACIEISGNPIAVGYTASKIRHLKKNNPDAYN